jgi:hypothetical protein
MVELYLNSSIGLHGMELNELNTWTILNFFTFVVMRVHGSVVG